MEADRSSASQEHLQERISSQNKKVSIIETTSFARRTEGRGGKMDGEMKKLTHVCLTAITSLCYCYFISAKIPKGIFRFISLLPIFFIFSILPLHLSSAFFTAITTFFFTWLANFKLILFAFDLGPLSLSQSKISPSIFITSASFPIRVKQKSDTNYEYPITPKKLPLNLGTQTLACAILIAVVHNYRDELNPRSLLIVYCFMVFLLVEMMVVLSSFVVRALTGLELEPPSDEPYLSTSLQEFWGKRWNLTVTNTLHHTIYKPVRSIAARLLGNDWARLLAVLASFLVSGLMHELLFAYVARAKPTWEMTSYFVVQGVGVVVEIWVKRWVKGRWRLPLFVSGPLTVGFVVVTSFWLFFPPLIRNGSDRAVIEELRAFSELVKIRVIALVSIIQSGYQKFSLNESLHLW